MRCAFDGAGVVLAVLLCSAAAVALQVLDRSAARARAGEARDRRGGGRPSAWSPTFMIVWMRAPRRRASPATCARTRGRPSSRGLGRGRWWAMAFFAVMREGLETAVFLLAAFQASGDSTAGAGLGAAAGRGRLRWVAAGHLHRRRAARPWALLPGDLPCCWCSFAAGLVARRDPHGPRGGLAQRPAGTRRWT